MTEMNIDIERLKTDREYWDSVAPEGATHYAKSGNWWKLGENGWFLLKSGRWVEIPSFPLLAIERPPEKLQAVEWDGTALPPVGCECDLSVGFNCGIRAKITYMGDGVFCYLNLKNGSEYTGSISDSTFRPIRTKEQRKRDEVLSMLDEAVKGMNVSIDCSAAITATAEAILSRYSLEPKD